MQGPVGALYVDDGGKGGVPVVFVHASAGNTGHWAAQLAHLRRRQRAIALDLRGHGRSALSWDGRYSVEALAEDVEAVVRGLGLTRYVLVGHSLGGAVCVAQAAAHPGAVAGLFLLDPASDGRDMPPEQAQGLMAALASDDWAQVVEQFWSPMLADSRPEVRARIVADLRRTPREAVRGPLGALLTFDPVAALKRYRGPRLSVVTRFNDAPGSYHRLVADLPSRPMEGVGHWVQLDAPEAVNAALDAFLAQLGGASSTTE
ncbi:alpha/beta hydrolase [Corallococcus sp. H22C18031201]|uniref:alpha/beta fold hydrolase n=1 Tax=Citreicoccus inhibens TaxID=2849499 RepID=UPI000E74363B|nr:alpha/beta fold hydrolase [Citreicoccus inhibens]MBU8895409.1 alpha/beta fold hydrolase [Citreicoccus inhibens]RJS22555.1 alpha/beta hydrolase [Corallococcus sp. H22C18031201]